MDERFAVGIGARVRAARAASHQPQVVVAGLSLAMAWAVSRGSPSQA
jgi:hypothetical protein